MRNSNNQQQMMLSAIKMLLKQNVIPRGPPRGPHGPPPFMARRGPPPPQRRRGPPQPRGGGGMLDLPPEMMGQMGMAGGMGGGMGGGFGGNGFNLPHSLDFVMTC